MARASPLPAASPISGIPASKMTKMAEIRSLARHPATPAAPIAAATANESRPSGSTKASSLNTRHRLAHRRSAAGEDLPCFPDGVVHQHIAGRRIGPPPAGHRFVGRCHNLDHVSGWHRLTVPWRLRAPATCTFYLVYSPWMPSFD